MNQILIADADHSDAEPLAALVNRAYRPAAGAEGWTHESALISGNRVSRAMIESALDSTLVMVGRCRQELVGCVQIELRDDVAHIGMLAVDPSVQASGIGKKLLARAEEVAAHTYGATAALLLVVAARTELLDFYVRRGYSHTGEQAQYPAHAGVGIPCQQAMRLIYLKKDLSPVF